MRALGIKVKNEELRKRIVVLRNGGNGTIELNGTIESSNKYEGGFCDTRLHINKIPFSRKPSWDRDRGKRTLCWIARPR